MTTQVQNLLHSYETLSDSDKRELVVEIIRRSQEIALPSLTDQQLIDAAELTFLELDHCEVNGK